MNRRPRACAGLDARRAIERSAARPPPVSTSAGALYRFLFAHWCLAFVLMGVCFVFFGLMSLNLVQTLIANVEFLGRHGLLAVAEGALYQLAELVLSGYTAAAFYVAFKLCEKALVDRACSSRRPRQ